MKRICMILAIISGLGFVAQAATFKTTLSRALLSKLMNITATVTGRDFSQGLELKYANTTDNEIAITVDAGTTFKAETEGFQHMVCWGGETLSIPAHGTASQVVHVFCGWKPGHCPLKNASFHFYKRQDSSLNRLLVWAKKEGVNSSAVQRTVWCFTNNQCPNSIAIGDEHSKEYTLACKVADHFHLEHPKVQVYEYWHCFGGNSVFDSRNNRINLPFSWGYDGYRHMYLVVLKEDGTVYKRIDNGWTYNQYGISTTVEFDPNKDTHGSYTVQLYDEHHQVRQVKKVFVSSDPWEVFRHQNDV